MSFEDRFSAQAEAYARYRPTYPHELFVFLADLAPARDIAIDCGTGNGQAAVGLAEFFDEVIAIDPSAEQLARAETHPRVRYRSDRAERIDAPDASADLVTVAQALHWFDLKVFFQEVDRVLKPAGVFAAWCYQLCRITPAIDAVMDRFYHEITGPFWAPERRMVDEGYADIEIPFEEVRTLPTFQMTATWSVNHALGYMSSWSAVQACRRQTGRDLIAEIKPYLERAWGEPDRSHDVRFPFALRVARKVRKAKTA